MSTDLKSSCGLSTKIKETFRTSHLSLLCTLPYVNDLFYFTLFTTKGLFVCLSTDTHKGQMRHEGSAVEALNQPRAY